jgi:hypothetical protein
MMPRRGCTRRQLALRLLAGIATGSIAAASLFDFGGEPRFVIDETDRIVATDAFGVTLAQASLLARFRRPITDRQHAPNDGGLGRRLLEDFGADRALVDELGAFVSDRERLLVCLLMRVNGSIPIFDPAKGINADPENLLLSRTGNCAHLATRLALVLESVGMECRVVCWWSPSVEGHVFVEARDPADGIAYILDPTLNLVLRDENPKRDEWFLEHLERLTPRERRALLEPGLRHFPFLYSRLRSEQIDERTWATNNALRARDSTLSALMYDLPIARGQWESGKQPRPARVADFVAGLAKPPTDRSGG